MEDNLFKKYEILSKITIFECILVVLFMFLYNQLFHLKYCLNKVRKRAKIRNQYNQVPHLTQDTNLKVRNSQLDFTYESQE